MSDASSISSDDAPRELVLCFDGTGNTFKADGTDSNILKIFRMLDRTKEDRCKLLCSIHVVSANEYHNQSATINVCLFSCKPEDHDRVSNKQTAGIGTDITPASFANFSIRPESKAWIGKAFDLALATSFDQHVIGGYRFLSRRWKQGAKIYLFGFSRGAYTARFLNEMLDNIGLLSADNEELIPLVWEAFTEWKFAPKSHEKERANAYKCLQLARETMCRPIGEVHFLGLFDTVKSVAEFNSPSDLRPMPTIMRHALSIDERRIKFQPVLFEPSFSAAPRDCKAVDVEEVYFAGDHSDVGGGWTPEPNEVWPASHIPLMWMVQEAVNAGLTFDNKKLMELGCKRPTQDDVALWSLEAARTSEIHDSLSYDDGGFFETFFWRLLEYFPFKRPKIGPDGDVTMTRWHTRGMRRPIPQGAKIHGSVIYRLRTDPEYRPFNLGLGRKPTGRVQDRNIGKWNCIEDEGMRRYWVKE